MTRNVRALGRAPWGLLLLAAGCVTHRGAWHTGGTSDHHMEASTDADPTVEVVLVANLAPEDGGAEAVASRVEEILAVDRPRVVLWLGNVAGQPFRTVTPREARRGPRCSLLESAWSTGAAATLAAAVKREAPKHAFATVGELDHRCGYGPQIRANEQGPWQVPGTHYVLRVHADGQVQVTASCRQGACSFTPPTNTASSEPLVDLVVVDLSPWLHPSEQPEARRADELEVQAMEALLTEVGNAPAESGPPRLHGDLVSDDEPRVEANAELADQVGVFPGVTGHLAEEFSRAGLRDRAQVLDDVVTRHADTVVRDTDRACVLVDLDANAEIGIVTH